MSYPLFPYTTLFRSTAVKYAPFGDRNLGINSVNANRKTIIFARGIDGKVCRKGLPLHIARGRLLSNLDLVVARLSTIVMPGHLHSGIVCGRRRDDQSPLSIKLVIHSGAEVGAAPVFNNLQSAV